MNNMLEAALHKPKVNLVGDEGSIERARDCSTSKTYRILVSDANIAQS
jgi:hypothetical protein